MFAPGPATRPALPFFELLLRSTNSADSRHVLFGVLHPADEFVARQNGDVLPRGERRRVGDQRRAKVRRQLVHRPTWHSWTTHVARVAARSEDLPPWTTRRGLSLAGLRRLIGKGSRSVTPGTGSRGDLNRSRGRGRRRSSHAANILDVLGPCSLGLCHEY